MVLSEKSLKNQRHQNYHNTYLVVRPDLKLFIIFIDSQLCWMPKYQCWIRTCSPDAARGIAVYASFRLTHRCQEFRLREGVGASWREEKSWQYTELSSLRQTSFEQEAQRWHE